MIFMVIQEYLFALNRGKDGAFLEFTELAPFDKHG